MGLYLRARGAKVASVASFHAYEVPWIYDDPMQRFGSNVVLQGCCINGHVVLPATEENNEVALVTGRTEIGDNSVVHPGSISFAGLALGNRPGTVIQSCAAGTSANARGVHQVDSWARLRPSTSTRSSTDDDDDDDEDDLRAPLLGPPGGSYV